MPVNAAMHRLLMLLTFTTAAIAAATPAAACDCPTPSPGEALARAAAVFEGTVTQKIPLEDLAAESGNVAKGVRIQFSVSRAWKGVDQETYSIFISTENDPCAVPFVEGESYVVYATKNSQGPLPVVETCSRSKKTTEAAEDLTALGMGVVPVDTTKSVERAQPTTPAAHRAGCASCAIGRSTAAMPRSAGLLFALSAMWLGRHRRTRRA